MARLTEHDDVIKPLLRGAPRQGLALGPAPARAGPILTILNPVATLVVALSNNNNYLKSV